MYVRRLNRAKLDAGQKIEVGDVTIYLHSDEGRSSLVVVIDAPQSHDIAITTGLDDRAAQNRLPIPPLT